MSIYGTPRTDTPAELTSRGLSIVAHPNNGWCYHMRNPHGSGDVYGACRQRVEDAVQDARGRVIVQQRLIVVEGI